jgi:hypothetical protein
MGNPTVKQSEFLEVPLCIAEGFHSNSKGKELPRERSPISSGRVAECSLLARESSLAYSLYAAPMEAELTWAA